MSEAVESSLKAAWKAVRDAEIAALARRAHPKRPAVVAFGRLNPPTTGHARLVDFLRAEAEKRGATPILFLSGSQDSDRNPLPFAEKVKMVRQLFPGLAVSGNPVIRTPIQALAAVSQMGFDACWFVVGSDNTREFERFGHYIKPAGLKDGRNIILKQYGVLTVPGVRDAQASDVTGMSGTKLRQAARADEWMTFQQGVPTTNETLARQIYRSTRKHMGLAESMHRPKAFLLYSTTRADAKALREGFATVKAAHPKIFVKDVSGAGYTDIRHLHQLLERKGFATTIYVKEAPLPRHINESWLRAQSVYGMIRQHLTRDLVILGPQGVMEAITHAELMLEAEGAAPKPKEQSEADRLKMAQKQKDNLTKLQDSQQLFQAKQRDLQKKQRDDQAKISQKSAQPKSKG